MGSTVRMFWFVTRLLGRSPSPQKNTADDLFLHGQYFFGHVSIFAIE